MPSIVSGMTSCWKSVRNLFGCTRKKRASRETSKRKVTVVESTPNKSETTAELGVKTFEITENDELWAVVSTPNRKKVVDRGPAILETIFEEDEETDPHLPSSDEPKELSHPMLAKGFATFDQLDSLREEIKQLKAKNSELITELDMVKRENYKLVLLTGVQDQRLTKYEKIFNTCRTVVSDSLELMRTTASKDMDKKVDGTISNVRPLSRDVVVVHQMPTENGCRPQVESEAEDENRLTAKIGQVEAEDSRQKTELAVYKDGLEGFSELKKEVSSLSSETLPQPNLPCLETDLDDPQQTHCLFTAV